MTDSEPIAAWLREDWPLWVAAALALGATIVGYPSFPEEIPIHWNMYGEPDAFAPKWWGAWLLPAVGLATYAASLVALRTLPRTEDLLNDRRIVQLARISGPFFMAVLQMVTVAIWLGVEVSILDVTYVAIGGLYALLGNYMPRVDPNWVFGIRVPWTLESDEVWYRTHRLAGPIWVLGGVSLSLTPWIGAEVGKTVYFLAVTGVLVVVPVVAAYLWYRDLEPS